MNGARLQVAKNPLWRVTPRSGNLSKSRTAGSLLIKLLNLDHVGIAVNNLDHALDEYRLKYGITPLYRETVSSQGVEEAMIPLGGSYIQLLQPLAADTPVGRFLARKGEGVHHLAYAVADIKEALSHLKKQGARLIDSEARPGGGGSRIAFVHPRDLAGTLIELVEPSHD